MLTLAIVVAYRFMQPRQFRVTPTDFLVIFLAIVAPSLIGTAIPQGNIMAIGAKTVILFYAFELLIANIDGKEVILRCANVAVLAMLSLRALSLEDHVL